jgi:hypothetical protein
VAWEGVPDAAQLRTVLWGQLNDRHKVSSNLLRPRASRLTRPVFVAPNSMAGTYRRDRAAFHPVPGTFEIVTDLVIQLYPADLLSKE